MDIMHLLHISYMYASHCTINMLTLFRLLFLTIWFSFERAIPVDRAYRYTSVVSAATVPVPNTKARNEECTSVFTHSLIIICNFTALYNANTNLMIPLGALITSDRNLIKCLWFFNDTAAANTTLIDFQNNR